ncbi:MAG: acyltransferase domain-containing protein, partial [Gemmatimonadota bacterium]|nr:acyltransferase domain-containing protein [Gemmatimonadota bacterium]
LSAVHLACQSLRGRDCELALAGGVNVMLTPDMFITTAKNRMLSTRGRCSTFDAAADGFVRGEGCGIVVLKRLSSAVADGDPILAVIRGSAMNQDGASSGITVPNKLAQEAVIRDALAAADVQPHEVHYVEAHGTGTPLGDPIELRALGAVLGQGRSADAPFYVGSVKTNIGHLEAASGIAGLIKVILMLQRGEIPPHLHIRQPSPHIPWEEIPAAVPATRVPWTAGAGSRVAGVSSFGASGTNVHVVVGEFVERGASSVERGASSVERRASSVERQHVGRGVARDGVQTPERPVQLLALSGRTRDDLRAQATNFRDYLAGDPHPPAPSAASGRGGGTQAVGGGAGSLADICHTAAVGRTHFAHRLAVLGAEPGQMVQRLDAYLSGSDVSGLVTGEVRASVRPRVAFLFTGQGAQYVGMARQLYETEPRFRQTLERCEEILRPHLDPPLLPVLYPAPGEEAEAQALLDQTLYTQPALFAIEYALCELWRSWEIEPHAVLGHSVGEYVAACVAGVFSLEEGLGLVAERARLMQALPAGGAMAAVFAGEEEVRRGVAPYAQQVAIAALNGPENTVISGEGMAVQRVLEELAARGIHSRALQVSHAFHSPLVDPVRAPFATAAASTRFAPPRMALISNLTGRPAGAEIATPEYWTEQLTAPVAFAAGMHSLRESGCQLFLEVGPGSTLVAMGQRCVGDGLWLASVRSGRDDWAQILDSLAALYTSGAVPDWEGFHRDHSRQKVVLPTYPFQRTRYWPAERSTRPAPASQEDAPDPLEIGDWLYRPTWRPAARMGEADSPGTTLPGHWLILADDAGEGVALAAALEARGDSCTIARPAGQPAGGSGVTRSFDPADPAALQSLISEAMTAEAPLRGVVHLWSLDSARADVLELAAVERALTLGGVAVLHLVQALAAAKLDPSAEAPRLWVVTRGGQMVGEEPMQAAGVAQAPLWGMGKTIALEHPELWGGVIDLDPARSGDDSARIVAELRH